MKAHRQSKYIKMETRNVIDEAVSFTTAFQMVGDSMDNGSKRSFDDGDYLICDEVDVQDMQMNRQYVIKVGNTHLVRRITSFDDKHVTVSPLNPLYKERQLCIDDIQKLFLIKSCQRKVVDSQEGGTR